MTLAGEESERITLTSADVGAVTESMQERPSLISS